MSTAPVINSVALCTSAIIITGGNEGTKRIQDMNIYIAVDLFAVIVLMYLIIIDFFTMIFRITGLPDEKARFQVISTGEEKQ